MPYMLHALAQPYQTQSSTGTTKVNRTSMSGSPWRVTGSMFEEQVAAFPLNYSNSYSFVLERSRVEEIGGMELSIGDLFAKLSASVSPEAWDAIPADLSSRFRHYSHND